MSRLEVLKKSLEKKEILFNEKLVNHFADVKSANGQPLNDKRNGGVTLDRWDKQNESLRNLKQSVEKTKSAIEREESKIAYVEALSSEIPKEIMDLVEKGILTQWRKNPNFFFVVGVEKARIVWDLKKKVVAHRYIREIKDKAQWALFRDVYNRLNAQLNTENSND
ncbi:hypothetical protein EXE30_06705 [Acinetobacter halotolerans]|uniref:Uncharacterized protein n=1 Tax=Acinetobacter halotolerans TaxID=1752076 RepID=A0A4Q6XHJ2_9GAMM|nr:hypothetical protein [Acinetobacter halotolerans]RZF53659.1 hypothetical protein EXE30_06705 [Acinetobacter halotolerans]